jgi:hypothetical protein
MWCQQFDKLIRVNADGAGGVAYPLPSDASYPYSIAPGPVGSIWFGRHSGGTIFTSPSRGSVGWVDQASGAVNLINTGSRTAPSSLIQGPDGSMWFTSIGADDAIGHVSPSGVGAVTKVGNYKPHSMTFGPDGAVWFADRENNEIVRVTTDELQTTNIDLGDGSQIVAPKAPVAPGGLLTKSKPVKAKKGKARLDEILDDKANKASGGTATRTPVAKTPPSGGLPTWTPGSVDNANDEEAADPFDTASSEGSWDSWEKEWPADADTLILEEDDPLASLDRLDDIDPVAEVERLDAVDDDPFASLRGGIDVDGEVEETFELDELTELDDDPIAAPAASGSAFSFSAAPAVINEEVSTADDIMAASTATELHVEDAGDSELARLLAKVQARLSAYE